MLKSDRVELRRRSPLAGDSLGSEGGREIIDVGRRRAGGVSSTVTERRRAWPAGEGVEAEGAAEGGENMKEAAAAAAAAAVGGEAGGKGGQGRDAGASCSMSSMVRMW